MIYSFLQNITNNESNLSSNKHFFGNLKMPVYRYKNELNKYQTIELFGYI